MEVQGQLLAYPPMDPACRAASYHREPDAFPPPNLLRAAWRSWLDEPSTPSPGRDGGPLRSPLDAESLAGLAPVLLAVGERDPVRDDVATYASRLRNDGVHVGYRVLPGIEHGDVLRPASSVMIALAMALTNLYEKELQ